jgi:hypothetical protein
MSAFDSHTVSAMSGVAISETSSFDDLVGTLDDVQAATSDNRPRLVVLRIGD